MFTYGVEGEVFFIFNRRIGIVRMGQSVSRESAVAEDPGLWDKLRRWET